MESAQDVSDVGWGQSGAKPVTVRRFIRRIGEASRARCARCLHPRCARESTQSIAGGSLLCDNGELWTAGPTGKAVGGGGARRAQWAMKAGGVAMRHRAYRARCVRRLSPSRARCARRLRPRCARDSTRCARDSCCDNAELKSRGDASPPCGVVTNARPTCRRRRPPG